MGSIYLFVEEEVEVRRSEINCFVFVRRGGVGIEYRVSGFGVGFIRSGFGFSILVFFFGFL